MVASLGAGVLTVTDNDPTGSQTVNLSGTGARILSLR